MTAISTPWPATFWRTLHPAQPSNLFRLLMYAVITSSMMFVTGAAMYTLSAFNFLNQFRGIPWWATYSYLLRHILEWDFHFGGAGWFSLVFLFWPLLTFLSLLIFQASMRKAKIRTVHVMRCVIYSCDMGWWMWLAPGLIALMLWLADRQLSISSDFLNGLISLAELICVIMVIWRLTLAYKFYLRFAHPLAVTLFSQLIVFLIFWKIWYVIDQNRW